ncbi:hypothetical protein OAF98_02295 [Planctomicrobium sp.]|jgi:hypothetical protein|nr:hypothetical protein [Planctomicrobium sp.]MBT5018296.1 hypothetical protein [Planctomicrobium sp.]MDA7503593.1 hypothetical protein [bacterium]MDB4743291.1 hypothetical protein [Planctomicrobium sp.]
MDIREHLSHYWITFPDDSTFPIGQGVTAYTPYDAFSLLTDRGYDFHTRAARVDVREIRSLDDISDFDVFGTCGPLRFRGIWYPCLNIGIDASGR